MVKPIYFCAEDIMAETVPIDKFLVRCSNNREATIDYLVTEQELNSVEFFDPMYSQPLKHLIKSMKDRSKEDSQASARYPISDRIIWSVSTTNTITLSQSIVKDRIVHGYNVYQDLMGKVGATDVRNLKKINQPQGEVKDCYLC